MPVSDSIQHSVGKVKHILHATTSQPELQQPQPRKGPPTTPSGVPPGWIHHEIDGGAKGSRSAARPTAGVKIRRQTDGGG